jgi:hypothetical protein
MGGPDNGGETTSEDRGSAAGGSGAQGAGSTRVWGVSTERLRVSGGELWTRLRQLVHEGNVRRIIVRGHDERVLLDIPVTVGVAGAVLAPVAVAIAAAAALATRCTIEVERTELRWAATGAGTAPGEAAGEAGEQGTEAAGTGEDSAQRAEETPTG